VTVRIRLKKLGRAHRPFFRLCAIADRAPRDGKAIEELGIYDPLVKDVDARAILKGERISYWLSVGAQPSENALVLIKKYGQNGTHLAQQQAALERIKSTKPQAPAPYIPPPKPAEPEAPAAEAAPEGGEAAAEQPAAESAAT
jgi:small subunit ribosomal protein S16